MDSHGIEPLLRRILGASGDELVRLLEEADALALDQIEAKGHLAWYYLNNSRPERSLDLYRELLTHYPEDDECQRRLADSLVMLRRTDEALDLYRGILKRGTYPGLEEVETLARDLGGVPLSYFINRRMLKMAAGLFRGSPISWFRMARELISLGADPPEVQGEIHPAELFRYLANYRDTTHRWPATVCALCGASRAGTFYLNSLHRIVSCRECGLERVARAPRGGCDVDMGTYDSDWYADGIAQEHWDQPKWRESRINRFRELLGSWALADHNRAGRRRALEIGAGRGDMMSIVRDLGWEVSGIEAGSRFAREGRERYGLNILNGTLDDVRRISPEPWDVVMAFHVIEHLGRPDDLLIAARDVLKPDGILIIETPVTPLRTATRHQRRDACHGYRVLEHVYFFTEATLVALLQRHGFQVLKTQHNHLHSGHVLLACAAAMGQGNRHQEALEDTEK